MSSHIGKPPRPETDTKQALHEIGERGIAQATARIQQVTLAAANEKIRMLIDPKTPATRSAGAKAEPRDEAIYRYGYYASGSRAAIHRHEQSYRETVDAGDEPCRQRLSRNLLLANILRLQTEF